MRKLSMNEFVLKGLKDKDTATVNAMELHDLVINYKLLQAQVESLKLDYERVSENNKMLCESNIELQAKVALLEDKANKKTIIGLGDILDRRV